MTTIYYNGTTINNIFDCLAQDEDCSSMQCLNFWAKNGHIQVNNMT